MDGQQSLSEQQLTHFVEEGYLVARGLLDYELDIAPVIAEYEARLDEVLAGWQAAGLIGDGWEERPFSDRIIHIVSQTDLDYSQPLTYPNGFPISGFVDSQTLFVCKNAFIPSIPFSRPYPDCL